MTREEFLLKWFVTIPGTAGWVGFNADFDSLISTVRREALEEARKLADGYAQASSLDCGCYDFIEGELADLAKEGGK